MGRLVASNVERLVAYAPGKPIEELERELGITGAIKLASNESPVGRSLLGRKKGDKVLVKVPAGDFTYKITSIS